MEGDSRQAGRHVVQWDTRSDQGDVLPAGMYFIRFSANIGNGETVSANEQIAVIR
jgi:flagellar hook assembly protein FlgD